jgi:hypothetical protein
MQIASPPFRGKRRTRLNPLPRVKVPKSDLVWGGGIFGGTLGFATGKVIHNHKKGKLLTKLQEAQKQRNEQAQATTTQQINTLNDREAGFIAKTTTAGAGMGGGVSRHNPLIFGIKEKNSAKTR